MRFQVGTARLLVGAMMFAVIVSLGCASAMKVRRESTTAVAGSEAPGIPFFSHKEVFKQTTIWERKWLLVSLGYEITRSPDGKTKVSEKATIVTRAVPLSATNELKELQTAILSLGSGDAEYKDVIEKFKSLPDTAKRIETSLVANHVEPQAVVDYSRTYYLNASQPWFGSAEVTTSLGKGGTLTSGTVSVTSDFAAGVSSLLPIKEFASGRLGVDSKAVADLNLRAGEMVTLQLKEEHQGIQIIVSQITPGNPRLDPAGFRVLPFDSTLGSREFVIKAIPQNTAETPAPKQSEEEEEGDGGEKR